MTKSNENPYRVWHFGGAHVLSGVGADQRLMPQIAA
jgi:hypothetical protein